MRTVAARSALSGKGQCTTTAIALELGELHDPVVMAPAVVIKDWAFLWGHAKSHRAVIVKEWFKAVKRLKGPGKWLRVKGPLGATICTLRDLGFHPDQPNEWRTPDGVTWKFNDKLMDLPVHYYASALMQYTIKNTWVKASEHRNGKGIAEGVDFEVLKSHLESLNANEAHGKAGLLRKAACSALWPRQRSHQADLVSSPLCPRCGEENEDEFHRIWTCKANHYDFNEDIRDSEHLLQEAACQREDQAALWCRGLVPRNFTLPEAPEWNPRPMQLGSCLSPGTFYLDGSGGAHSADPRLRRCGWAAVKLDMSICDDPVVVEALFGPLGGPDQKVARAELNAAVQVLEHLADIAGDVHLISDCSFVTEGFDIITHGKFEKFKHSDLWVQLQEMVLRRRSAGFRVTVRKVKAHVEEWHLVAGLISFEDFTGNEFADAFAKQAANMLAVPRAQVKEIKDIDKKALLIQKRIIATNAMAISCKGNRQSEENDPELFGAPKSKILGVHKSKRFGRPSTAKKNVLQEAARLGHSFQKEFSHSKDKFIYRCRLCLSAKTRAGICKLLSQQVACPGAAEPCSSETREPEAHIETGEPEAHVVSQEQFEEEDPFDLGNLGFDDGEPCRPSRTSPTEAFLSPPPETDRERLHRLQDSLRKRPPHPTPSLHASQFNLGGAILHRSHRLHHHRGVIWCQSCGCYGAEVLKNLSKPCAITPGRAGRWALSRLQAGNPPRSGMQWPLAAGSGPCSGIVMCE